ncbi:glycine oxidase ThiO [Bacillus sp. SG-1]|uniref:glycine oxidase ThiO n=1 Tax=Bacillus sp. SG-1 TaxID=161544 RepID=UPI0001543543|nr:glycine oxidase ThiO [Bacillus sp. SG-1]EDL65535.1 glycine oxidase [Bacillus sp. SG-1]
MNNFYDVIIVGGGIIGSSVAYQQSKQGKKVVILEKGKPGCEASSAAAGMLGAQAEIDESDSLLKLALKSRSMFPVLIKELEELTGVHTGLINKGMLKVAESTGDVENLKTQVDYHTGWDPEVTWLTQGELLKQESALSHNLAGGMFIPNDGQVMAPQLSQAFLQGAAAYGADIFEYSEVEDVLYKGQRINGVKTSQGNFYAETVVITNGAWAGKLIKKTGISLDIIPVKGECFSVIPLKPLIRSTVFSDKGCYIVPKKDGRLIVGATSYLNSFDKSVSLEGISRLLEKAISLIPDIQYAKWEKAWAGIRPQSGDGLPYIGPHPECRGLFIAAGHYRNGILLSPITGKMISDMIDNQATGEELKLYESFKIDRKTATTSQEGYR